jgi:hypothetical protein
MSLDLLIYTRFSLNPCTRILQSTLRELKISQTDFMQTGNSLIGVAFHLVQWIGLFFF